MARGQVSLEITLSGKDKLSGVVGTIQGKIKDARHDLVVWADGFNEVAGAAGKVLGVMRDVYAHVAAGEEAANANVVFARSWDDAAGAMARFREATEGTIDDTTLQQRTKAMQLMGLSAVEAADAMAGAFKLAAATGKNTEDALNAVLGGVRGELDALKGLGVQVDLNAVYSSAAASLGKTTAELSAQEKQAARTAAVLGELAAKAATVSMEGLSFETSKLTTNWTNLVSNLDVLAFEVLKEPLSALSFYVGALADGAGELGGVLDAAAVSIDTVRAAAKNTHDPIVQLGSQVAKMRQAGASVAQVAEFVERAGVAAGMSADQIRDLAAAMDIADRAAGMLAGSVSGLGDAVREQSMRELADFGSMVRDMASNIAGTMGGTADAVQSTVAKVLAKKKGKGGKSESIDLGFADTLSEMLRGTDDQLADLAAYFDEQAALLADSIAKTDRLNALGDETERVRRADQLAEDDRLGRLRLDHELSLRELLRTVRDDEEYAAQVALENARFAADERKAIRDKELDDIRESLGALDDAMGAMGRLDEQGIGSGITRSLGFIADNFDKLKAHSPAAISALGNVAASAIKNDAAVAAIRIIMELAAGTAAAVTPGMQWAAAGHFAAAALYGTAAAMGGKGGGGSGGASAAPRLSGGQGSGGGGGGGKDSIVVHNYGVLGMGSQQAGQSLAAIAGKVAGSGFEAPGAGRL